MLIAGLRHPVVAAELRIEIQDAEAGGPLADVGVEVLLPVDLQAAHT